MKLTNLKNFTLEEEKRISEELKDLKMLWRMLRKGYMDRGDVKALFCGEFNYLYFLLTGKEL